MKKLFRLGLQFFGGEGTGAGASSAGSAGEGGGQASGVNATAAAEQRLRELGVPEAKAKQRASKYASHMPAAEAKSASSVATAATNGSTPTEVKEDQKSQRLSWKDIKRDPEYKKQYDAEMQNAILSRLKTEKKNAQPARDALAAMTPALELMAKKYGLDTKNMDYKALATAIENDDAYYEQKAMELGTSVETARRIDQLERSEERKKAAQAKTLEEMKKRNHIMKIASQSEALRKTFPNFDIRAELKNPAFARLVDPSIGMSVEDAYHAVHRKEIQAAQMQYAAKRTAEQMSNAIASGQKRPDEAGSTGQAPSVSTFDYRNASKAQREALKKEIRAAAARGEKVYPK